MLAEGDDGELLDLAAIAPELAGWYNALHPMRQQLLMHLARVHVDHFGSTLAEAVRATAALEGAWQRVQPDGESMTPVARELKALNLLAELKAEGRFLFVNSADELFVGGDELPPDRQAAVADLDAELKALIRAGEFGELVEVEDLAPDLALWYRSLDPVRQQAVFFCARGHQQTFGSSLPEAFRAVAKTLADNWAHAGNTGRHDH